MDKESELREALENMCYQFAYWSDSVGGIWTGGLSTLEDAFFTLGWENPHPIPGMRCDFKGCMSQATCGTPTKNGYKSLCGKHLDDVCNDVS